LLVIYIVAYETLQSDELQDTVSASLNTWRREITEEDYVL